MEGSDGCTRPFNVRSVADCRRKKAAREGRCRRPPCSRGKRPDRMGCVHAEEEEADGRSWMRTEGGEGEHAGGAEGVGCMGGIPGRRWGKREVTCRGW